MFTNGSREMKGNKIRINGVVREPLSSDIIFKAVYGRDTPESKAAIIALLNLVLDRGDDPIMVN